MDMKYDRKLVGVKGNWALAWKANPLKIAEFRLESFFKWNFFLLWITF